MKQAACLAVLAGFACNAVAAATIVVGSKNFTENYILAEVAAQLLESHGFDVERRQGLNGTKISYEALQNHAIDLYPEYTGTVTEVILERPELTEIDDIRAALRERKLLLLDPLGFNNTYAIGVAPGIAASAGLRQISDLRGHDDLRVAFAHEFLSRPDGWPGLKKAYGLGLSVRGIDHGLAYEAITTGQLDVTASYSTDGEITRSGLVLLEDNLDYFPEYLAAYLAHDDLPAEAAEILGTLRGRIDNERMQALNLSAIDPSISIASVAAQFLQDEGLVANGSRRDSFLPQLWRNTARHLQLTATALLFAVLVGVGLAVTVYRHRALSNTFLYVSGLLQTVPSIALLALMIPLLGVGRKPAIVALFLYSLLPIARSTITAMHAIPAGYRQVAAAMAMTRVQELRHVLMPLAMPHVLAGIRTAAVICIGTATLAAFIGAGGLGDPIVTGLALNDSRLILQGAIPAAGLAILTEMLFGLVERWLVVPHMRNNQGR